MNALSNPFLAQAEHQHNHEAFKLRTASVDQLIDTKHTFVMECARLQAVAESRPELRDRCHALVKTIEEQINTLQEQIDRDIQGLLYSLQKGPAPSSVMDNLPG